MAYELFLAIDRSKLFSLFIKGNFRYAISMILISSFAIVRLIFKGKHLFLVPYNSFALHRGLYLFFKEVSKNNSTFLILLSSILFEGLTVISFIISLEVPWEAYQGVSSFYLMLVSFVFGLSDDLGKLEDLQR